MSEEMKKKKLWWILGGLLALIVLLLILKAAGVIGSSKGLKVALDTVSERRIIETVNASGKIYPETEVKIKAGVSGEIVELPVEEGDSVVKGQLLARVNSSMYHSAVAQSEASLQQTKAGVRNAKELAAQAKAQLDRAKSNFNRNEQLYKDKVISRTEYEQLQSDYLTAKASYDAAIANISAGQSGVAASQANLSQSEESLRKTIITAPTSGIISQLLVKKGEMVVGTQQMDGTQILTIADMGRMELRVDVSETDISKVSIGDTSIIEVDAYRNMRFKGIVSKISVSSTELNATASSSLSASTSTDQVTNYTVHIFILPQSYQDLRVKLGKGRFPFKPGMSAGVEIQTRSENNVLSIPINAVTTRDKPDTASEPKDNAIAAGFSQVQQVVFVYDKAGGKVHIQKVKTGIQDNEYIQVTEGLKKGDKVVVAPYGTVARLLQDGSSVTPVPKDQLYETEKKE
jgi:HlyD family secretion protein